MHTGYTSTPALVLVEFNLLLAFLCKIPGGSGALPSHVGTSLSASEGGRLCLLICINSVFIRPPDYHRAFCDDQKILKLINQNFAPLLSSPRTRQLKAANKTGPLYSNSKGLQIEIKIIYHGGFFRRLRVKRNVLE